MPIIQHLPPIQREFIRMEVLDCTVRIFVGRYWMSRPDIVACLQEHGVFPSDILNIYQTENTSEWFVQFKTPTKAESFVTIRPELYWDDRTFYVSLLNRQHVQVRVHWVHTFVHPDYILWMARKWGDVRNVAKERVGGYLTNIYVVDLEVTLEQKSQIPHMVVLPDKTSFLITVQGRPPMCLLCGDIGHIRSKCPRTPPPGTHRGGPRRWEKPAEPVNNSGNIDSRQGTQSNQQSPSQLDQQSTQQSPSQLVQQSTQQSPSQLVQQSTQQSSGSVNKPADETELKIPSTIGSSQPPAAQPQPPPRKRETKKRTSTFTDLDMTSNKSARSAFEDVNMFDGLEEDDSDGDHNLVIDESRVADET